VFDQEIFYMEAKPLVLFTCPDGCRAAKTIWIENSAETHQEIYCIFNRKSNSFSYPMPQPTPRDSECLTTIDTALRAARWQITPGDLRLVQEVTRGR
jgi:hypothetical protein